MNILGTCAELLCSLHIHSEGISVGTTTEAVTLPMLLTAADHVQNAL